VEAGRAGGAVFLIALVGLDKEVVTIGVKEIGRAQGAGLLGESGEDSQALVQRRRAAIRQPQALHARQQVTKGVFGIGVADRTEVAQGEVRVVVDPLERPVVRQDVHLAAQFTREGMSVLQPDASPGGLADVRDDGGAGKTARLDEAKPVAVVGGAGVLDQACVVLAVIGDAPTIGVRRAAAAVLGQGLER